MSVLGSESGLMSSFLSSEEIGELLDKVKYVMLVQLTFFKNINPEYLPALPSTFENIQLVNPASTSTSTSL